MIRSLILVWSSVLLASCGGGGGSTSDGGPAGFAPTFSVNGTMVGTQPVTLKVDEGTTDVAVVTSSGGTLSLSPDNDGALFVLAADGQLSFIESPDFENPGGNGTNIYTVRIDAMAGISAAVTLTVQVQDVPEGSVINGRVVDGPVSGAAVYADLNCNAIQDPEEPFGATDAAGFFELKTDVELADGCAGKFYSIGGTDIATGKVLENIQLSADLPTKVSVAVLDESGQPVLNEDGSAKQEEVFPKVAITPLTTIVAAATTVEEKEAVLESLGLGGVSVQEALTIDPWAGSESDDDSEAGLAAAVVAQAIQRVNTQVATIIKVAANVSATSQTGSQTAAQKAVALATAVQAVAKAIVVKSVAAVAESKATGVSVEVDLASSSVVADVIEATIVEVASAAAVAAGSTAEEAATIAAAKVTQVKSIITSASNTVEAVNTAAQDVTVNPTSTLGLALAVATEAQVVEQVANAVTQIKIVIDAGGSEADIAAAVAEEVVAIEATTIATILTAVVEAAEEIAAEAGEEPVVLPDLDGDGTPDVLDLDDDGDGVNDSQDAFPRDATETLDTDRDGIGNNLDTDDDGDSVLDAVDDLPLNPNESVDTDGDGIGNNADEDDDGDGVDDGDDAFPFDPKESLDTDGDGIGNNSDPDDDSDGVSDEDENTLGTDPLVADTDGDGEKDGADNCPLVDNADQLDTDEDGTGDACDIDDDADTILDTADNCPLIANTDQLDTDGDKVGDVCDSDDDGDTILDTADNCPLIANADQLDTDGDKAGNVCDADDDGDTILDTADNCPLTANTDQLDTDGDKVGDSCDTDKDGDGVSNDDDAFPLDKDESADTDGDKIGDNADNCSAVANSDQLNTDGDAFGNVCDTDDDGDTILDTLDNCPLIANTDQLDTDGDKAGNVCDADDDGDTILDTADNCPVTANTDQLDTDGDKVGDVCDTDKDGDGVSNDDDAFPLDKDESADTDGDKIGDNADNCSAVANADQLNTDGDALGNDCDGDDDGDGIADGDDVDPLNANVGNGFSLYRVGLQDHIDGRAVPVVYGLMPSVDGTTLSLDMKDNAVDLSNLRNLVDGNAATGVGPKFIMVLDRVPAAGTSGSMGLMVSITEGDDATRETGERALTAKLMVNWLSDGKDITLTVPAQSYEASEGLVFESDNSTVQVPFKNETTDIFKVNRDAAFANYPAALEVRAFDLFNISKQEIAKLSGVDLGSFFEAGTYFMKIAVDQGGNGNLFYQYAVGQKPLATLQGKINVAELTAAAPSGFDIKAELGSVSLTEPADPTIPNEVISLSPLLYGDALEFDFGAGQSLEASVINSLLNGNASDQVPLLNFSLNNVPEDVGDFTLTMTLTSGLDGTYNSGETQLSSSVDVGYSGDGVRATFLVPNQTQTVTVKDAFFPTGRTASLSSADSALLTVTAAGADYPATLTAKVTALFAANVGSSSALVEVIPGDYHLQISISGPGASAFSFGGLPMNTVRGVIRIK